MYHTHSPGTIAMNPAAKSPAREFQTSLLNKNIAIEVKPLYVYINR